MEVWIIVLIRLILYPIFFSIIFSFIQLGIGFFNSVSRHKIKENGKDIIEFRLNSHKWEENSQNPRGQITRVLLFVGSYFALKYLIFQLLTEMGEGLSLGFLWNSIIMIASLIIFAKIINPILVILFTKNLPGFKERWEGRTVRD